MRDRRPQLTSAALLGSATLWAGIVSSSDVYDTSSSFVLGAGLLLIAAVSIVGMVAGAARWAMRLALGLAGTMVVIGAVFPLSPWTVGAMVLAGAAGAGLAGDSFGRLIRQRPPADGPPARAVLLSLVLLIAPPAWALAAVDGLGTGALIAAVTAWVALVWYTRAAPGALLVVRVAVPVVMLASAFVSVLPVALLVTLTALAETWLAWTVDARIAVHPLAEPGTRVPIPPELAPRDVLDAAGLDDRGKRKDAGS